MWNAVVIFCKRMSPFTNKCTIGCAVRFNAIALRMKRLHHQRRNMSISFEIDDDFLKPFRRIGYNFIRCGVAEREVSDLSKLTRDQKRKIPKGYLNFLAGDVSGQAHLRWMLQKDSLQQDTLLVSSGGAGAVHCRRMAMAYAELVQRPVEVIIISPDTTVEDILQRRTLQKQECLTRLELGCDDMGGVKAALQGHILILDGLHRAERNVISSLRSLLEHREVLLGDGRRLISSENYLTLKENELIKKYSGIFPISEDFRILALWSKNIDQLDPSVRSHFQIHRVDVPPCDVLYEQLLVNHAHNKLETTPDPNDKAVSHAFTIPDSVNGIVIPNISVEKSARELSTLVSVMNYSGLSKSRTFGFSLDAMYAIHQIRLHFPKTPLSDLLYRAYPYACMESRLRSYMDMWPMASASRTLMRHACEEIGIPLEDTSNNASAYTLVRVEPIAHDPRTVLVHFSQQKMFKKQGIFASMFNDFSFGDVIVKVPSGGLLSAQQKTSNKDFVTTIGVKEVLVAMLQEHFGGRDILLVGPRGEGKSTIAKHFCSVLGYDAHVFILHKDMKGTDLLWKNLSGHNTGWTETPLLTAARYGQVCILDGIEKLSPDTFSVLQGIITNRELVLPDSTIYSNVVSTEKFDDDVRKIHDAFRVVALASIKQPGTLNSPSPPTWLSEEVNSMFATISLPAPTRECFNLILKNRNEVFSQSDMNKLYNFYQGMLEVSHTCSVPPFSIRSMVRFVKRGIIPGVMASKGGLYDSLHSHMQINMLHNTPQSAFESIALGADIMETAKTLTRTEPGISIAENLKIQVMEKLIKIGDVEAPRLCPTQSELVPYPVVNDSTSRIAIMQLLLHEFSRGERSFMLIGNGNDGLKQFCDGMCGLINHEREYIHLNHNWTIDQLTLPSKHCEKHTESTLVRAILNGFAVVIDGIDEASSEIKAMLKILASDKMLTLSDGRKMGRVDFGNDLHIHPNFTLWILTRRHTNLSSGHDFFKHDGDIFSMHFVPAVDIETVISDCRPSFPLVEESTIHRIFMLFDELRKLYESGDVDHPYSTSEAIAVANHLQKYPKDDASMILHDVLDFDSYDERQYKIFENKFNQFNFTFPPYHVYERTVMQSLNCGQLRDEYESRSAEQISTKAGTVLTSDHAIRASEEVADVLHCGTGNASAQHNTT